MIPLLAAAFFFVGIHLFVSGTALRGRLVAILGDGPYRGLFSATSLIGVVWMSMAFGPAKAEATPLWMPPPGAGWLVLVLGFIATLFAVIGLTTPSPTAMGMEKTMALEPRGILRITRHPFLSGVAIWATAHILVNGDTAALVFFGAFLILGLAGPGSIDAKRARAFGEAWAPFAARTSALPFLAIAQGRNQLVVRELADWRLAAALALFAGLIVVHPLVFAVAAWPQN